MKPRLRESTDSACFSRLLQHPARKQRVFFQSGAYVCLVLEPVICHNLVRHHIGQSTLGLHRISALHSTAAEYWPISRRFDSSLMVQVGRLAAGWILQASCSLYVVCVLHYMLIILRLSVHFTDAFVCHIFYHSTMPRKNAQSHKHQGRLLHINDGANAPWKK